MFLARFAGGILGCICLLAPLAIQAQGPGATEGSINGTGMIEIKRPAQLLRMKVQLVSKGKDLKGALAKLEERKGSAQKQLEKLGAVADSIHLGAPEIQEADPNARRQMEMMMAQRGRTGKKKPTKTGVPVSVICPLEADWELTGTGAELLLAAHQLEEQIKAADMGGASDAGQVSAEDQELLEEMQENMGVFGNQGGELKPGEPVFAYVSRLSEADRDAALGNAFRKAQDEAALLAKAAGLKLGNVRSLSTYGGNSWANNYRDDYTRMQRLQAAFGNGNDDDGQSTLGLEAFGAAPTQVRHTITVTAVFDAQ